MESMVWYMGSCLAGYSPTLMCSFLGRKGLPNRCLPYPLWNKMSAFVEGVCVISESVVEDLIEMHTRLTDELEKITAHLTQNNAKITTQTVAYLKAQKEGPN